MKAKLYTLGTAMEVRISNKFYTSLENEPKKEFVKRVKELLELDFDEAIDLVDVKTESLKQLDDALVIEAYKASKGLQSQIFEEILKERGIEFEKIEKTSRKKVEKVDIEVMKASEEYKTAKANVGRLCQFSPTKEVEDGAEVVVNKGIVKSISLNKTNTIIYYNVLCGTKLKCSTSQNKTLEFFDF